MGTYSGTMITTWVDGTPTRHGADFEAAAQAWDAATSALGHSVPGGISIQIRDAAGILVRDGWLLHVHNDGTVYVHPRALVLA
jgi:hypothetical protein